MTTITWPTASVLMVLIASISALTWKGTIPTHILFALAGAVLGYLVPKAPPISSETKRLLKEYNTSSFDPNEAPTNPGSTGKSLKPPSEKE